MPRNLLEVTNLSIGYGQHELIKGIHLHLAAGEIYSLIGPNGTGKTTLLRTIARLEKPLSGNIMLAGKDLKNWSNRELAQKLSVVMTDRISSGQLTCYDLVASGRYAYTGVFGLLTEEDKHVIEEAMRMTDCLSLYRQRLNKISDGQRQRVLIARTLAQGADLILMDEPTGFLDIRYQLELQDLILRLAREEHKSVLLSLHELNMAEKLSDYVLALKDNRVAYQGTPREIFQQPIIEDLYDLPPGSYHPDFGEIALTPPAGKIKLFVFAGNGSGIPYFRALSRLRLPFASGILMENDIDCRLAQSLSSCVITESAFHSVSPATLQKAQECLRSCQYFIDAYTLKYRQAQTFPHTGEWHLAHQKLVQLARDWGLTEITSPEEMKLP